MDKYRLHYFPESGNSYKLALMLTLCGQTFEPIWTDFGGGVTRTDEWRRSVNPMGEIPVLEENSVKLTQTGPILLHLASKFGCFAGTDDDVASRGATCANALGFLEEPNAHLETEIFGGQRTNRTNIDGVERVIIVERRTGEG